MSVFCAHWMSTIPTSGGQNFVQCGRHCPILCSLPQLGYRIHYRYSKSSLQKKTKKHFSWNRPSIGRGNCRSDLWNGTLEDCLYFHFANAATGLYGSFGVF